MGKGGGVLRAPRTDRSFRAPQIESRCRRGGVERAAEGLAVLEGFEPPTWLAGSYIWAAVLADLHGRCGNFEVANRYRDIAFESAPTPAVKALLQRRLLI